MDSDSNEEASESTGLIEVEEGELQEVVAEAIEPLQVVPLLQASGEQAAIFPMDHGDYHADNSAWGRSMIWDFLDRRRIAYAKYVKQNGPKRRAKKQMDKGTLFHAGVLEPETYGQQFAVYPPEKLGKGGAITTKAAKAFRAEQEALGRIVMQGHEMASVQAMITSVNTKMASWLDVPSRREHAIYWQHTPTGLWLKCKIDWIIETVTKVIVIDLKGTADASPDGFHRRIGEDGYWLQDAHYKQGVGAALGKPVEMWFVACDSEFPYTTGIHKIDATSASEAAAAHGAALAAIKRCLETGDWSEPWEHRLNEATVRPYQFEKGRDTQAEFASLVADFNKQNGNGESDE